MGLTREEATAILEECRCQNQVMRDNPTTFWTSFQMTEGIANAKKRIAALNLALAALRGPTREQVEKVWRGEWELVRRMAAAQEFRCSVCGANNTYYGHPEKFCADCGSAMTDEAVDMMLERWKEALNGKAD